MSELGETPHRPDQVVGTTFQPEIIKENQLNLPAIIDSAYKAHSKMMAKLEQKALPDTIGSVSGVSVEESPETVFSRSDADCHRRIEAIATANGITSVDPGFLCNKPLRQVVQGQRDGQPVVIITSQLPKRGGYEEREIFLRAGLDGTSRYPTYPALGDIWPLLGYGMIGDQETCRLYTIEPYVKMMEVNPADDELLASFRKMNPNLFFQIVTQLAQFLERAEQPVSINIGGRKQHVLILPRDTRGDNVLLIGGRKVIVRDLGQWLMVPNTPNNRLFAKAALWASLNELITCLGYFHYTGMPFSLNGYSMKAKLITAAGGQIDPRAKAFRILWNQHLSPLLINASKLSNRTGEYFPNLKPAKGEMGHYVVSSPATVLRFILAQSGCWSPLES